MHNMDMQKLQAIKELMDELVSEMEPGQEDFDARLGKPKVDVLSVQGEAPLEGAEEGGLEAMEEPDVFGGSPEDKLKERILKLKG